ncbi:unnamed protein product, partial [marine sediment metagenome]
VKLTHNTPPYYGWGVQWSDTPTFFIKDGKDGRKHKGQIKRAF